MIALCAWWLPPSGPGCPEPPPSAPSQRPVAVASRFLLRIRRWLTPAPFFFALKYAACNKIERHSTLYTVYSLHAGLTREKMRHSRFVGACPTNWSTEMGRIEIGPTLRSPSRCVRFKILDFLASASAMLVGDGGRRREEAHGRCARGEGVARSFGMHTASDYLPRLARAARRVARPSPQRPSAA